MSEPIILLDTCIIMKNPKLLGYEGKTVYVSSYVNDELDNHKSDQGRIGENVRHYYNYIKKREFFEDGTAVLDNITFMPILKEELPIRFTKADDFFIGVDFAPLGEYVIHTHDYSLSERLRLSGKNVEWIDQDDNKMTGLRTGKIQVDVNFQTIGKFKGKGSLQWKDISADEPPEGNAMVEFCVNGIPHYTGRYRPNSKAVTKITSEGFYKGVQPKNLEQEYFSALLSDPDIKVITVSGAAGTGKTYLTLAAALQFTSKGLYDSILLGKGTMPLNKWSYQGFTKGDTIKKLFSHMSNFTTNIKDILGKEALEKSFKKVEHTDKGQQTEIDKDVMFMTMLEKKYNVQLLDISSIKGSNHKNAFIIVDEAQEFSNADMRAIASRVASGTKLVVLGDPLQQGCERVARDRSGFATLISEFEDVAEFAHIELSKCERSSVTKIVCERFDRVLGFNK